MKLVQTFLKAQYICWWRAGLVQAIESYRMWPEGPGFESRSPRIAQARVRLATNTLPQTPHRAGALCTGYALYLNLGGYDNTINVQICTKKERLHVLLSLLERDAPKSGIIFVAEQVLVYVMFFWYHTMLFT